MAVGVSTTPLGRGNRPRAEVGQLGDLSQDADSGGWRSAFRTDVDHDS
jgi:hypothetical protein